MNWYLWWWDLWTERLVCRIDRIRRWTAWARVNGPNSEGGHHPIYIYMHAIVSMCILCAPISHIGIPSPVVDSVSCWMPFLICLCVRETDGKTWMPISSSRFDCEERCGKKNYVDCLPLSERSRERWCPNGKNGAITFFFSRITESSLAWKTHIWWTYPAHGIITNIFTKTEPKNIKKNKKPRIKLCSVIGIKEETSPIRQEPESKKIRWFDKMSPPPILPVLIKTQNPSLCFPIISSWPCKNAHNHLSHSPVIWSQIRMEDTQEKKYKNYIWPEHRAIV